MSAHMRKHHTRSHKESASHSHKVAILYVRNDNVIYAIPLKVAEKYIVKVQQATSSPSNVSANKVFAELDEKYTKAGVLLKGVRVRENISQIEFAKRIDVTQANLSKMENGKRPIGKNIAKRIEKEFGVNYRYFLE